MWENIREAFDGIRSHKLRSALTMLGIIIGIASIITISSTIMGTNEQIKENLIGAGNNTVEIVLYQGDYPFDASYQSLPEYVPVLDRSIKKEINAIPEIAASSLFTKRDAYGIIWNGTTGMNQGTVYGVDETFLSVYGYVIRAGRGFVDKDFSGFRKVCLIDRIASESLFLGESPIGKTIEIAGEPYTVVGEFTQSSAFQPTITSIDDYYTYSDHSGGKVLIPIETWSVLFKFDIPASLVARATGTDAMTQAGKAAADLLNGLYTVENPEVKYKSQDLLEQAKQLQELSNATSRQLIWVAGISLLVGGIGVMNIMLVSVTERTPEIGLKKALGAKRRKISMQFLTEAGVLTCIGGMLGVLAGIGLAYVVSRVSGVPIFISWYIVVLTVAFSFVVGLFFGAVPAVQAARLNPIDALRRE
ncbi:MAG: ABC transporter permease [Clostridia bacterium]|nr:ABC transporter permease [Clostridia bacterium]